MDGLRRSIQGNFATILLILVAGGFLVLSVELVLFQHWQGVQLIGLGSVLLGLILTVAALFVQGGGANVVGVLLLVLSLVGLVGVFEHYQARQAQTAAFQRFAQGQGGFPGGQGGAQAGAAGAQANAQGTPAAVQESSQQSGTQSGGQAGGQTGGQNGGQGGGQGGFARGGGRGRFGAGANGGGLSFREPIPPPLAPLSLTGLSLVAAVVVLGASRKVTASEAEQALSTPPQFGQETMKG